MAPESLKTKPNKPTSGTSIRWGAMFRTPTDFRAQQYGCEKSHSFLSLRSERCVV